VPTRRYPTILFFVSVFTLAACSTSDPAGNGQGGSGNGPQEAIADNLFEDVLTPLGGVPGAYGAKKTVV